MNSKEIHRLAAIDQNSLKNTKNKAIVQEKKY